MGKKCKYLVANHVFEIEIPEGYDCGLYLKPYEPFVYEGSQPSLFKLKVEQAENLTNVNPGEVKECFNDESPFLWIFSGDQHYNFGFSYTKNHPDCILKPENDFKDSILYIPTAYADRILEFAVSNALMLLYTYNTTPYETLLIHSSVIVKDSKAYSFLGKSGTGKSTHSRLWLENIPETHLLNDDNPVIRLVGGQVMIFGSPWSGKTPCYKNESYPLFGIVRLTQALHNTIQRLRTLESYACLLPACSCMKWSRSQTDSLHKTVEAVVKQVACWSLECLPDGDAAEVCYNSVK